MKLGTYFGKPISEKSTKKELLEVIKFLLEQNKKLEIERNHYELHALDVPSQKVSK